MSVDRESLLESLGSARKFADPSSPASMRKMAAGGALPLPPVQIASVLYALLSDEDEPIRTRAEASLRELPDRVLEAALTGEVPGGLLDHLAHVHREDADRLEAIALNAHTQDGTFCFLASLPHPRVIEIVSRNQTRLMRCARLIETLGDNPATSAATLDRVLEFMGIPRSGEPSDAEDAPPAVEPAADTSRPDEARFDPDSVDDLPPELLEEESKEGDAEEDTSEGTGRSLTARISEMSVMQRIKLARFGNGEARGILVRDRNKMVCSAAIKSPKITESEVLSFAKNRAIPEEVLRIIAGNREWTRSRALQAALCVHPKTPIPTAMKFLNNLTDLELKQIMKSKDVAAQISIHARRLLVKKGKL